MDSKRRNLMPKKKHIVKYWNNELEILLNIGGFKLETEVCFACGNCIGLTHRAHIVSIGEKFCSNDLSNFHILCKGCHSESEYMNIGQYWRWFFYQFNNNFWFANTINKIQNKIINN